MKLSFGCRCWAVAGLVALSQTGLSLAQSADIAGLFSTGAGGTAGAADLHYSLIAAPAGADSIALLPGSLPISWIAAPTNTSWLALADDANHAEPTGDYTYRLTFKLEDSAGHALNPDTASLSGEFAADDFCTVLLNGTTVAGASYDTNFAQFATFTTFDLSSGFVAGANTLDFIVQNSGSQSNPTGLLVASLCGTAQLEVVPEPGPLTLLGLGLITLVAVMQFKSARRTPKAALVRRRRPPPGRIQRG